jgi:hypothetical protein
MIDTLLNWVFFVTYFVGESTSYTLPRFIALEIGERDRKIFGNVMSIWSIKCWNLLTLNLQSYQRHYIEIRNILLKISKLTNDIFRKYELILVQTTNLCNSVINIIRYFLAYQKLYSLHQLIYFIQI